MRVEESYTRRVVPREVDDMRTLPKIFCFSNGGAPGFMTAIAIAEDGKVLGSHMCSSEGWMPIDLGVIEGYRRDRHEEQYSVHYPDGYEMEWVPYNAIDTHEALTKAFDANAALALEAAFALEAASAAESEVRSDDS
jgi:hypothetical protein